MPIKPILAASALALAAAVAAPAPAHAEVQALAMPDSGLHAGQLDVPLNKSQVLRSDRPYAKALIGNSEIADVLPLTNRSLYVLGKKLGTTSLTLYDGNRNLIAVVDVVVGPDVITLRRQLAELLPGSEIGARVANDSVVLTGVVASSPVVKRAAEIAETYAPGKVVNMMAVGSSQQVMLEVRFSEMKRQAGKQIGVSNIFSTNGGSVTGVLGNNASLSGDENGIGKITLGAIADRFGIISSTFTLAGVDIQNVLDGLERKGLITTLAEPTLVALSGDTASFLAGGEFPIPVLQDNGGGGGGNGTASRSITVEFKPFGVSLAFTPTVLEDGIINLVVAPEVSSIDPTASVNINGLVIPGLQTRRARTTVELRDGESFAMAGLLRRDFQDTVRQFPLLGSIPIIGSLFRSTSFQKEETELVIIVTPRLVKPVPALAMKLPTDRATPPDEADLFLLGRTDGAVGVNPADPLQPPPRPKRPIGQMPENPATPSVPAAGGIDGDHGHMLEDK
ncbi:MAG TPA: type II and III secretion system protein family protein [Allosphingosinicella sp.]